MTGAEVAPFPLIAWIDRRSRRQMMFVALIVGGIVLARLVRWAAAVQLDRWWLDSVTNAPVWRTRTFAIVLLGLCSFLISIVVMGAAWAKAEKTGAPSGQPTFGPVAFVAGRLGPLTTWVAWLLPLYLAMRIAGASSDHWQEWVLFRNSTPSGVAAPEVGFDVSYHLLALPLLEVVFRWLSQLLLVTLGVTAALLTLNGAIRLPVRGRRSNPDAVRLLVIIGAGFLAVQAFGYWFVRYPLLASSGRGRFSGGSWAELHSQGLIYRPLAILSVFAAAALIASGVRRLRFRYSVGLVIVIGVLHLGIAWLLPTVLQRLVVNPSEFAREAPLLEHNRAWTQTAYNIDAASVREMELDPAPTKKPKIDKVPRFDQQTLAAPFQVLQGTRGSKVVDVDLDRYLIDGERRPVFVGARIASRTELPDTSWVNTHLVYTHGDGVVAAPADELTAAGGLKFAGLGQQLGAAETPLYFGAGLEDWFAVVGTDRAEIGGTQFAANTGISIGSTFRQVVSGLAIGDYNLFVSSEVNPGAQLLYRRSLAERVSQIAPFLAVDGDPYPVITDDDVVWMADAYIMSNYFPYSQHIKSEAFADETQDGDTQFNYMKHAAVVTMSASDGTFSLYRSGQRSELLDAWDRALPGLFQPLTDLPEALSAHRRYPVSLFMVQTSLMGRYHVDSAEDLYSGDDAWLISPTVRLADDDSPNRPALPVLQFLDSAGGSWVSTRPYSPGQLPNPASGRDELAGLAVANHDTNELSIFRLRSSRPSQLPSPQVAQSILASDPEISQLLTLLNANGSTVEFGPITPLVENGGLSWYRSIVVSSTAKISTPRLHSGVSITADGLNVVEQSGDATVPTQAADAQANGQPEPAPPWPAATTEPDQASNR